MESDSPNGKRTVVSLHVGFHWGGTEAREQLHAQFLSLKKKQQPQNQVYCLHKRREEEEEYYWPAYSYTV